MRSSGVRRGLLAALVVLIVALVTACGVRAQDTAETVPRDAPPAAELGEPNRPSGPRLTVFLVRGADLAPVERRITAFSPAAALSEVVDGPTRTEAADGIRTALAPEVEGVGTVGPGGTATVALSRGFAGITGGNQLLAVAQIVWTLTALPTVQNVRFTVEEVPVEVPTDAGLSSAPVDRDDFRSVAPPETAAGSPTTSTAPGSTGSPTEGGPAPR